MAAGTFSGRFTLTSAAQTLDALTGGVQTYSYIALRARNLGVFVGPAAVTVANGYQLDPDGHPLIINQSVTGAAVGLIGPGIVDFVGIATL